MWSNGATLWIAENGDGADDATYAYDLKTGERLQDREFELGERNRAPRGSGPTGRPSGLRTVAGTSCSPISSRRGERLPTPGKTVRLNDATQRLVLLARARPGLTGATALFGLLLLVYSASIDIRATRDASITADEPFYLVTTQSLLQDGDLDLRNQYAARSYESFFDHPDGLWTQSVPLADGRVLSPHNVGLSVLLLPGFAVDGLVGAQVQLVLTAALTWALAFVLALRFTGARPWLVWLATVAVALSATGSSTPPRCTRRCRPVWCWWAHCCSRPAGSGPASAGCCYSSVAFDAAVAGREVRAPGGPGRAVYVLWRADGQGRAALVVGGVASALAYGAFHLATYESLTPYNVNLVYAGDSTPERWRGTSTSAIGCTGCGAC